MFAKFKKKNNEAQSNIESEDGTSVPTVTKKRLRAPDMVLIGGLIFIVVGLFWFMSGGLDDNTKKSTKSSKEKNESKEEKPPFVYENNMQTKSSTELNKTEEKSKELIPKAKVEGVEVKDKAPFVYENSTDFGDDMLQPPPESYEKNNTALAKKIPKREETIAKSKSKSLPKTEDIVPHIKSNSLSNAHEINVNTVVSSPIQAKKAMVSKDRLAQSGAYVCRIVEGYKNMLGKEIMYYVKHKDSNKYTPAYALSNWDESGVLVKERFVATKVDVAERMVEVYAGKWIPALEFMTCTLVEESMR